MGAYYVIVVVFVVLVLVVITIDENGGGKVRDATNIPKTKQKVTQTIMKQRESVENQEKTNTNRREISSIRRYQTIRSVSHVLQIPLFSSFVVFAGWASFRSLSFDITCTPLLPPKVIWIRTHPIFGVCVRVSISAQTCNENNTHTIHYFFLVA